MRRTSLADSVCPIARSLDQVGDWWTLLIVRDALKGACRFGEFQTSLGVAKNILSARLSKMVGDGLFEVVPAADGSEYSEYRLTSKGRGLGTVTAALYAWGDEYLFSSDEEKDPLVGSTPAESSAG